ncbi:MAG: helix-turn-helix domain-containing protein [bacterium]
MEGLEETVCTNLRAIREERGFTQEELSQRSDLAVSDVEELETGERTLQPDDIIKLAVELETKVSDLFVSNGQPLDHAKSLERYPYDLGSLIVNSEDEDVNSEVPDVDSLIDTTDAMLVLLDEDGQIILANDQYESLAGSREEDTDQLFWESPLWFGANQRRIKHLVDEAREDQFMREVIPLKTPKGSTRPMTVNVCPVFTDDSKQFIVEGHSHSS